MKTSLAYLLSQDIEAFATRLRESHPLMALAQHGQFSPEGVATYLMNVRFLVEQTPRHLAAASKSARSLGKPELADLFKRKLAEETGHDEWATDDLRLMKTLFYAEVAVEPSRHLRDTVHALDRTIAEQPSRYLAYTLFVEYLTVLLGPIWVNTLSERCGVPVEALSVIHKHAELDVNHVSEELREIDELLGSEDPIPYVDTLHSAMRNFELFCDELFLKSGSGESAVAAAE